MTNDNELCFSDKLNLTVKSVYGRQLIYPNCETSRKLVGLTMRRTFNDEDLVILKDLGFSLVITAEV